MFRGCNPSVLCYQGSCDHPGDLQKMTVSSLWKALSKLTTNSLQILSESCTNSLRVLRIYGELARFRCGFYPNGTFGEITVKPSESISCTCIVNLIVYERTVFGITTNIKLQCVFLSWAMLTNLQCFYCSSIFNNRDNLSRAAQ